MTKITYELLSSKALDLAQSPFFHVLIWMVFFDIFTGYAKAIKQKRLDSKVSTNGWIRHICVLGIVFIVGVYARSLGQPLFSIAIALGFIGSYGLSLLENLEALGVWFPEGMKEFFRQMRDKKINIPNAQVTIKAENIENIEIPKDNINK